MSSNLLSRSPLFRLDPKWFCGPLCIWGKLPGHGDFLRSHTNSFQAPDWQNWVSKVWSGRPRTAHASREHGSNWVSLDPPKTRADLGTVPVSFVMQPGVMPFSGKSFVQGVLMPSEDQVGREFPLIIFQQVSPFWMRQIWGVQKTGHLPDGSNGSSTPVPGTGTTNVLYWLSRLMARTHAADKGWAELTRAVDALDTLYRPHWRNLFGAAHTPPDRARLTDIVANYCNVETLDVAWGLRGVQQFPWANWPSRILRKEKPTNAFWQQDIEGGYVNVSETIRNLWRDSA